MLDKHEGPSSNPQNPREKLGVTFVYTWNYSAVKGNGGGGDRRISGATRLTSDSARDSVSREYERE